MRAIDLLGHRFGRLVVVSEAGRHEAGLVLWRCVCDCGTEKVTNSHYLRNGNVKSCGCLAHEPADNRTHGMSDSVEYMTFIEMRKRCLNPKNKTFKYYGAKGIKICDRWDKFENFFQDMGRRPDGTTLDRKNPRGDYTPDNCRWATPLVQQNNRTNNFIVEYKGEKIPVRLLDRKLGFRPGTIYQRLWRGWTLETAVREKT